MRIPELPYNMNPNKMEIVQMRGINWSDNLRDGDLRDSLNLSARRWPYITTRKGRVKQTAYQNVTALTAWAKLVAVRGTSLLYDGRVVGTVTAGKKQFAVVNTKLVIWPDKKYLDLNTSTLHELGASAEKANAVVTTDSITMTGAGLSSKFSAGDGITISGCTTKKENNKDIVIKAVDGDKLTFSANALVACTEAGTMKIERKIPDLDFICESENRLWGVSNANKFDSDARTAYEMRKVENQTYYAEAAKDGYLDEATNLTQRLVELAADPELRRAAGEASRRFMVERWNDRQCATRLADFLDHLE